MTVVFILQVMMWIEAVHNLLISDRQRSSTYLLSLTEEFFDYSLVISMTENESAVVSDTFSSQVSSLFQPIRSCNLIGPCKVLSCDTADRCSEYNLCLPQGSSWLDVGSPGGILPRVIIVFNFLIHFIFILFFQFNYFS